MSHITTASCSTHQLLQLLESDRDHLAQTHLACLDVSVLEYLQTKASGLHFRALGEARNLLDVALEALEHPLSPNHQRCLLERADDELASAQRWSELAANARFCREHPELALQLAGDASPDDETLDRAHQAAIGAPTPGRAKRGVKMQD
ncbi:hypothetical protein RDV84_10620 [Lysobacter yananisis]|uniref:Uncharacterized protein n=1 Tax=Lysobacter yananisis TaxID=1003114 RepID=A0ABY9PDY3_9GAMM|nr:hypothetical protein [Lysobacter yananisis]WMT05271.1 hypothetical protein RDV84_10620 [Lysobacter yananisis]